MIVGSNEKNYLFFMFMFICWLSEKKRKYKELKLAKLEFHITRNSSLVSSSMIEGKKKKSALHSSFVFTKHLSFEYCVAWNLRFWSLSSMWHFFNKKSTSAQVFFFIIIFFYFMKLKCLKLNLHNKLQFHELEF